MLIQGGIEEKRTNLYKSPIPVLYLTLTIAKNGVCPRRKWGLSPPRNGDSPWGGLFVRVGDGAEAEAAEGVVLLLPDLLGLLMCSSQPSDNRTFSDRRTFKDLTLFPVYELEVVSVQILKSIEKFVFGTRKPPSIS